MSQKQKQSRSPERRKPRFPGANDRPQAAFITTAPPPEPPPPPQDRRLRPRIRRVWQHFTRRKVGCGALNTAWAPQGTRSRRNHSRSGGFRLPFADPEGPLSHPAPRHGSTKTLRDDQTHARNEPAPAPKHLLGCHASASRTTSPEPDTTSSSRQSTADLRRTHRRDPPHPPARNHPPRYRRRRSLNAATARRETPTWSPPDLRRSRLPIIAKPSASRLSAKRLARALLPSFLHQPGTADRSGAGELWIFAESPYAGRVCGAHVQTGRNGAARGCSHGAGQRAQCLNS